MTNEKCGEMAFPFHLESATVDGQQVVTVTGEIDMSVADEFEQALVAAVAAMPPGGLVAVDLEKVGFFGSSATRALVRGAEVAQDADVGMHVTASRIVRAVLEIVGVGPASHPAISLGEAQEAAGTRDVAPRLRREWRVNLVPVTRPTRGPGGHAGTAPG
ncbi:MAG TPA: STAS domain-containing protein [Actinospica sp.]|jgi:anti-anti-sigma factor|nr:STAS domain-containing protein [Actinospica sp.]